MRDNVPAWVSRMEASTEGTGYHCSSFEAHLVASTFRTQEAKIKRLHDELKLHREAWDEIAKAAINHYEKALVEEHRPRERGETV